MNEEKVAKNENFSHPERCTICGGEVWQLSTESLPTKRRHRVKQIGGGGSLYFITFKKER